MIEPIIIQKRHVKLMKNSVLALGHILDGVSQEEATTYRDSGDGWTVLEVVCHLRDFDGYFMGRAKSMVTNNTPTLPAYDHLQIAIDNKYNEQNLAEVYAELVDHRMKFREFYKSLSEDQWQSTGIHPESGHFTMHDSLMQVGHHDIDHLEQITRILKEKR